MLHGYRNNDVRAYLSLPTGVFVTPFNCISVEWVH